ncbi:hypothetical protein [Natronorubrum halophilum]|uniref:hypothetical protein n=1 Tax=Natronorubrum halophilum TaxID=1702106 RepID=UPI000EF7463D|nr:hypothetical protein [Natronorubrum halophilum]
MPEPRTQRFRGRSPPGRPEWTVSTVARRSRNRSEPTSCAVTEAPVELEDSHYFVTLTRETPGRFQPEDYEHLVVADGALDELDDWLEDSE